jgi:peptide/nickel transport system substrate-binding protein
MPAAPCAPLVHRSPRLSRRRLVALGGSTAAALALAACSGDDKKDGSGTSGQVTDVPGKDAVAYTWQLPDETAQAVPGGVYRGVTTGEVTTFDPVKSTSFTTQVLAASVYETLLRLKTGPGIDPTLGLEVEGRLAESFEIAPDAQQITFKMRPNVRFHNAPPVNGRVLDIDDWRLSLERFLAQSPYRANLAELLDKQEFPDERTMLLKLKRPYASIARLFTSGTATFWTLPKEAAEGGMNTDTQAIGTYHMQLDTFEPSVTWEYKKHLYWRQGTPFIDRWQFPIIPEYAQRAAQFKVGNIFEFTPRAQEVLVTRNDVPDARMFRTDVGTGWGVLFFGRKDFESAPWRDERVRRALSMMLDRGPMRAHFSNSEEFQAAGLPQETRWHSHVKGYWTGFWLNPETDQLGPASVSFKYDPAEAKKLLAAAGYPDGFELDFWYTDTPLYGADHAERCQITIDMLQKAGVKVRPNLMEYQAYLSQAYQRRDFRGIAPQPEFTYTEIDLELYNTYHSAGGRFKSVADPHVDQLIEAQRRELGPAKRAAIIHDLQKHLAAKMYTIPWDGTHSGFIFRWPWLRNNAWPGWNQWLTADTPKRNG